MTSDIQESTVDQESLQLFVGPPRQYPSVFSETGATYGIRFKDLTELLGSFASSLGFPMTKEMLPGCQPLYGGLSAHHLREHFVKQKIYPPTDETTKDLFVKCDAVHVAVSYVWRLPLLGLLDLLRGDMRHTPVQDDDIVWLDVLVIDQNAPDITKALTVSKQVYERSDRHYVLTVSCFDRTWCLYEMYLRLMSCVAMGEEQVSRSEFIEFRTIGGSQDEKDRKETLFQMGRRNILRDMQAFLAEDREAVRSTILSTTTEANFDGIMRAIYADFARQRRCSLAMETMICYYLGGQISDAELLRKSISEGDRDLVTNVHILEWPSDDLHICSRQLPLLCSDQSCSMSSEGEYSTVSP